MDDRPVTREDLSESVRSLGRLVDAKLDGILYKLTDLREDIRIHAETVNQEIVRVDKRHDIIAVDVGRLEKLAGRLAGALALLLVVVELFSHVLLK